MRARTPPGGTPSPGGAEAGRRRRRATVAAAQAPVTGRRWTNPGWWPSPCVRSTTGRAARPVRDTGGDDTPVPQYATRGAPAADPATVRQASRAPPSTGFAMGCRG
ncbi:hypothetical protein AQJ58_34855 [Streptomyces sp. DSM 15324]|nr:hypothetical protein AQJ58_34855 [Streptomyces sp. DSM 15324]